MPLMAINNFFQNNICDMCNTNKYMTNYSLRYVNI